MADVRGAGGGAGLPLRARNALAELLMEGLASRGRRGSIRAALALARGGAPEPGADQARARSALEEAGFSPGVPWSATAIGRLEAYAAAAQAPEGVTRVARLGQARALFARRLYFEVHEVLEPAWLAAAGEEKRWLQGLIQAAVAWYHAGNGNDRGAATLLAAAGEKLAGAPEVWGPLPVAPVRAALGLWADWLEGGRLGPEPPRPFRPPGEGS